MACCTGIAPNSEQDRGTGQRFLLHTLSMVALFCSGWEVVAGTSSFSTLMYVCWLHVFGEEEWIVSFD